MKKRYLLPLILMILLIAALCISAHADTLKLPPSLKHIGARAFMGDTSLGAVTLPENVLTIGDKAFANSSLTSIYLPPSLTYIADDAFSGCENFTVTAQEDSYAYVWAVGKGYIEVQGGEAGTPTKVVAPATLPAGADLKVSVFGAEDAVSHSVYLINEDTGDRKIWSIYDYNGGAKRDGTRTWYGYELEPGTYRLIVYTVTAQYQALQPVTKTILVTGTKAPAPEVSVPERMTYFEYVMDQKRQSPFGSDVEYAVYNYTHLNEGDNTQITPYTQHYSPGDSYWLDIFYGMQNGGTVTLRFAVKRDGFWSEWTEDKVITVTSISDFIHIPETIEAGKDFTFSYSLPEGVEIYSSDFSIYKEDGERLQIEHVSDLWPDTEITIPGRFLSAGNYSFSLYLYLNTDFGDCNIGRAFTVTGEQPPAPAVTADREELHVKETVTFTIDTAGADKVAISSCNNLYEGSSDTTVLNASGDAVTWSTQISNEYLEGYTVTYWFSVRKEGCWSETKKLSYTVQGIPPLEKPVIHANSTYQAGEDVVISFDEVENANGYDCWLSAFGTSESVYPDSRQVVLNGYELEPGSYRFRVTARSDVYGSSYAEVTFKIEGQKDDAPAVTPDRDVLRAGEKVNFAVDTENVELVYISYEYINNGPYDWGDRYVLEATGEQTVWQHSIDRDFEGGTFYLSVTVKRDGCWTEMTKLKYTIQGLPPLDQAVLHVNGSYEAGENVLLRFDAVENAERYWYSLYTSDGKVVGYYNNIDASPNSPIVVYGYELEPGSYRFKVTARSNDYADSSAETTFIVSGEKPAAPQVTVDKDEVFENDTITFTINSANADLLRYHFNEIDAGYPWETLSPQGTITKLSFGIIENSEFKFAAFENGRWTAWRTIQITLKVRPQLDAPAVTANEQLTAGEDFAFSFGAVENAETYYAYIRSDSDSRYYEWDASATLPGETLTAPGYLFKPGMYYTVYVQAQAADYKTGTASQLFGVSGSREEGPGVVPDKDPLRIKDTVNFTIDTEDAELVRLEVNYTRNNSTSGRNTYTIETTGEQTVWQRSIDSYYEGYTFNLSVTVKRNGRWTDWTRLSYTIAGLPPLDQAVLHAEESYEAGTDITLSFDAVQNAAYYDWHVYKGENDFRWNTNLSAPAATTLYGYIDPGTYRYVVVAYADGYAQSMAEATFVIAGEKAAAPQVSVDKTSVAPNEYYTFTVDTTGAERLVYSQTDYGIGSINVFSDSTKWKTYSYSEGEYAYRFCAKIDGRWTAWSAPVTVTVVLPPAPEAPSVTVDNETVDRRQDITVTVSGVEGATYYYVYLYDASGNQLTYQNINKAEGGTVTFYGYGTWPVGQLRVRAYASNGQSGSEYTTVLLTVTDGERPAAPEVTPPAETTVAAGSRFTFTVATAGADKAVVRYYPIDNTNNLNYSAFDVSDGDTTDYQRSLSAGAVYAYSFSVRTDGVWSEWSLFTEITAE
ncbi:MAG: leucine-rich repeat protein [Clostridia bacterium]|nr:leucine-rich repeat protein [Clostridia bacterium]